MNEGDPLPVDGDLLASSMFVGDVIAGHGLTPFLAAAEAAGCRTANGGHMVEAVQELMVDFMVGDRWQEPGSGPPAAHRPEAGVREPSGPA